MTVKKPCSPSAPASERSLLIFEINEVAAELDGIANSLVTVIESNADSNFRNASLDLVMKALWSQSKKLNQIHDDLKKEDVQ